MRRLSLGAPALALYAVLLVAGPAVSKVLVGTDGPDTLIGTKRSDQITGGRGQDRLIGKAGNDTYFFADNWDQDAALVEKRRRGKDTLNFSAVTGFVGVRIVREFGQFDVAGPNNERILLDPEAGIPFVETVIGGQGDGDGITTGGGPNTLKPGGGATDILQDLGGYDDGPGFAPEIPASDDTYMGFNFNTGTDTIRDWGGNDVVDMRPFSSTDVVMTAINGDSDVDGTKESLQIAMKNDPNVKVVINAHFGPYYPLSSQEGMDGRIEKLIFADVTYTAKNPLNLERTLAVEETRGKEAGPANEADQLAAEDSDTISEAASNDGEETGVAPGVAPDTRNDEADQGRKGKKAKKAKR